MNKLEDPIQFETNKSTGDVKLEYSDLREIVQGGPEIGCIAINGQSVRGRYGGPALIHDIYVYIPAFVQKILGSGFRLAKINSKTLEIEYIGSKRDLLFLDKLEGDQIYFYEDLGKTIQKQYRL